MSQCQTLDAKVNRAIMIIQEIELVSRGYRLSTPLAPISRIEQASKSRRCNMVRAQLVAALTKSGALFQRTTETLQSHIDPTRLNTLLDMYNITPSSRPGSPQNDEDNADTATPRPQEHHRHGHGHGRHSHTLSQDTNMTTDLDNQTLTTSPTSELPSPMPSSFSHRRHQSLSKRHSGMMTGHSRQNSRPSSFHEASFSTQQPYSDLHNVGLAATFNRGPLHVHRRHRTSWSASEGEDSDSGTGSMSTSPRFSALYTQTDDLSTLAATPEMTSLERLRKNFQLMHAHRREFLCELLSIRRKSRQGRQGLSAIKDYDRNWTVVRDVLQEGLTGIQSVVDELSKVLDSELCKFLGDMFARTRSFSLSY